ncbi:NUDIX hydrolase [Pelagibius sp. Alg239-R121]|uniref:NUDIX hydrolase n=1 Tax=Pelagibius sp. Alg239-R121 TaxID=2993448 RepID=UPI0024A67A10|nr:NUDIX domain-containing protein [Pelagibius sp. Alg239-R121]
MADTKTSWRPVQQVRPIAVGLVRRGRKILVAAVRADDGSIKGWRPLGGEIEFGERAEETLVREFDEELGEAVSVAAFVCVLENLYEHEGAKGHEIVFVYEAAFLKAEAYDVEDFAFTDGGLAADATWIAADEFRSGQQQLFPEGLSSYLT